MSKKKRNLTPEAERVRITFEKLTTNELAKLQPELVSDLVRLRANHGPKTLIETYKAQLAALKSVLRDRAADMAPPNSKSQKG
jgi:hypothetical protein